jgi:hypothetical protein
METLNYSKETVKYIAGEADMGMICFINEDTMEIESVPGQSSAFGDADFDGFYQETYDRVDSWGSFIRVDPPEPRESFKMMEDFIEKCIPDSDRIKNRLWDALSRRKPFRNFKNVIDDSPYRQRWFDFKQTWLEDFVRDQLPNIK